MAKDKRSQHSSGKAPRRRRARHGLPKVIGYDGEVGNFITGMSRALGTGQEASRAILCEFEGIRAEKRQPAGTWQSWTGWPANDYGYTAYRWGSGTHYGPAGPADRYDRRDAAPSGNGDDLVDSRPGAQRPHNPRLTPDHQAHTRLGITAVPHGYAGAGYSGGGAIQSDLQDVGRTFLAENGGCVYIDLDHIELCLPEVRSAFDHVACWHAMLRLLRAAVDAANRHQPPGCKVHVLLNNSDGEGHSYGTHTNFLITEQCRHNILERRMQHLLYLASYQASSILFTGQGKVGSENGAPAVAFQLSQRADFMEQLLAPQTTFCRPIVNSRDEPHCGTFAYRLTHAGGPQLARLHVIFYDSTLCQVSSLLKVGVMQIVLAMIEVGCIDRRLILEDPLQALSDWSHDPLLQARARLWSGGSMTAVELQFLFLEAAMKFVDRGGCDGIVPRAREIIDLWADTLALLHQRDLVALSKRLDWALKLSLIHRALDKRPHLEWSDPEIKRIDHQYSSLDLREGLYWSLESALERVVSDAEIERFLTDPPDDTRAWTRAMLLRRAGARRIESVDWDRIRFSGPAARTHSEDRTVQLANPLEFTRATMQDVFDGADSLDDILDVLSPNGPTPNSK